MAQIYILTPTTSEKRPINNRHKHINYPKANNTNVKFGINKPDTIDELLKRYTTHFKKEFKYKLIVKGKLEELINFEDCLKEVFLKYINNFREETNYPYTKEWMSGITFEEAEKIIKDEFEKFKNRMKAE